MNKYLLAMLLPFLGSFFKLSIDGDEGGGGSENTDDTVADGDDKETQKEDDKSGNRKPTNEEARLLKDVMTKKRKLEEADNKLKELEGKLKEFEGIDAGKVRELLKQQQQAETDRLKAAGDYEKLTAQMAEAHRAELEKERAGRSEIENKLSGYQKQIIELTIGNSFSQSEFIKEETLLTPAKARVIYASHFQLNEDGVLVGYDRSASDSKAAPLVDASGEPLAFEEAMRKIIDADPDRDLLLKSKMRKGADSGTDARSSKGSGAAKDEPKLTGKDKISAGLADAFKQSKK